MSKVRKIVISLIVLCYLMAFPPMFSLYNKPILVFGMPMFMFGLAALVLVMNGLVFFLYQYEDKRDREQKQK